MIRLLFTPVLALSFWMIFDGGRALITGAYTARIHSEKTAAVASGIIVPLDDGRFAEYGPWAYPFARLTIDPAVMAPFFIGLGVLGVLSLAFFLWSKSLEKRRLAYTGLIAFCITSLPYLIPGTIMASIALISLFSPSVRARLRPHSEVLTDA